MSERNQAIDIAKSLGIIGVVWEHIEQVCPIIQEFHMILMPLFFMLSGYFFNDAQMKFADVLKKRIKSYIIPYIILFTISLSIFITLYTLTGRSSQIFITPGIIIHPYGVVGPLWFLLCLFEVHMGYYFISHYIKNELGRFLCALTCFIIGYLLFKNSIELPIYIGTAFTMMLFFQAGNMLNKHSVSLKLGKKQLLACFVGILCYSMGVWCNLDIYVMNNVLGSNVILFICAAMGGSYAVIYISGYLTKLKFIAKPLSYIGKNTFVIFSLHMVSFEIVRCLFNFSFLEKSIFVWGLYLLLLGIIFSLFIGYPIKKYVLPYLTKIIFK